MKTDFLKQIAGQFQSVMNDISDGLKERGITSAQAISALAQPTAYRAIKAIIDVIAELIAGAKVSIQNSVLKLISAGTSIKIDAVDGSGTLSKAKEVFVWIDPDFVGYGADEPGLATKETPVAVYEIAKNSTFAQMFRSLSSNLNKLCLTQAQIKNFAEKHHNWLRTCGYGTFFLFKSNNNFFVAGVGVRSGGEFVVRAVRFEKDDVWSAEGKYRLIVPQLA